MTLNKPVAPVKPTEPKQTVPHCIDIERNQYECSYTGFLDDLITIFRHTLHSKGHNVEVSLKDISIHVSLGHAGEDSTVLFTYHGQLPNLDFQEQHKEYIEKLNDYNRLQREYKEELYKYMGTRLDDEREQRREQFLKLKAEFEPEG